MKIKLLIAVFFLSFLQTMHAERAQADSTLLLQSTVKLDSLFQSIFSKDSAVEAVPEMVVPAKKQQVQEAPDAERVYQPIDIDQLLMKIEMESPIGINRSTINSRFLDSNPLFSDLRFEGYGKYSKVFHPVSLQSYFDEQNKKLLIPDYYTPQYVFGPELYVGKLRDNTIRRLATYQPWFVQFNTDQLPDIKDFVDLKIDVAPLKRTILLDNAGINHADVSIEKFKVKYNPWTNKSYAMLQFSQNYVSPNWYRGGSDNVSILGILNGRFNYDDKKNVQWDNFVEWRLGFNSVDGDTIRFLNTNDDILRATSKLGIKAGGNWFYSGSVDFSTHFFNSYKGVNSTSIKAKFLTPVRFNVALGLDYKYKKLFSVMLSPLSYKFIFANDTINVPQNSFGIPKGQKVLSQIGSSFRAQFAYSPSREIQIDSKLSFYTNYEKVEIDWEITGNFMVNRFLSTRISLNPRYDNTVILAEGEKAAIQFKELLTFGLSYRLL